MTRVERALGEGELKPALKKSGALEVVEDRVESRALLRETAGAFGLLATALGGLALGLALEPGFLMKLSFVFSGTALWTCALVAIWPRTRRFAARLNRITCPQCGTNYRVSTEEILADIGNVRSSRTRSPSGFACYEVMCTECGTAHRFRRTGKLVGKSTWRRDRETEAVARSAAERALAAFDEGEYESVAGERMFWDGHLLPKSEWLAEIKRARGCVGRPTDRHTNPIVRWSNHPDSVSYAHYLEERELNRSDDSPFACEDFVSLTWTTVFAGVVATECVILGKRSSGWSVLGYRIEGVSEYVQLDGVGRLSLKDPDERGALSTVA